MDEMKLKKISEELEKARVKKAEWDTKVRELERKYREAENTCIHEMVHEANITPEQLSALIRRVKDGILPLGPADPGIAATMEIHEPDPDDGGAKEGGYADGSEGM